MLCISCPNRNVAPGFFSRCGVWLRLLADGGQLLHWWGVRWCWWLDRWGRFAASRERLTLWRNCGCFRNRRLRQNWVSRFGWIDGFDGWILRELRLFFHKGLPYLLLRCGCRCALWLLRVWSGAYILRALTRCIFCRWHGHCGMLRLLRRDRRRWRGRFCGLLNISTSGLFLRCGYRCALRRRCI